MMSPLLEYSLVIGASALFFVIAWRKELLGAPSSLFVTLLLGCYHSYLYVIYRGPSGLAAEDHSFALTNPTAAVPAAYFFVLAVALISQLLPARDGGRFVSREAADSRMRETLAKITAAIVRNMTMLTVVSGLMLCIHFIAIDKGLLWANSEYLAIFDPAVAMRDRHLIDIYHRLFRFNGLVCAGLAVVAFNLGKNWIGAANLSLVSYAYILSLAGNSRWAALYPLVLGVGAAMSRFPGRTPAALLLSLVTWLSFGSVIYGRAGILQGVSQIPYNIMEFARKPGSLVEFTFLNLTGAFTNLSAAATSLHADYDLLYKILSFSPFPSIIDHYPAVAATNHVKLLPYAPFGFFSEAYYFGPPFWIFCLVFLFFHFRTVDRLYRTLGTSSYLYLIPCLFAYLMFQQYSIRSTFRFFLYGTILAAVINSYLQRQAAAQPPELPQRPDAEPG